MKDALVKKIQQATFHLEKMHAANLDASQTEAFFSAFLSAFRSIAIYVRDHWEREGKIAKSSDQDWREKIHPFEDALSPNQLDAWRLLTRLRNKDTHEEPVIPDEGETHGYFPKGYFPEGYFPKGYFPEITQRTIMEPKTGKTYDLYELCKTGLGVARKLADQYDAL